jgi:hypothetical protein
LWRSPDGKTLAVARVNLRRENELRPWDLAEDSIKTLLDHTCWCGSMAFSLTANLQPPWKKAPTLSGDGWIAELRSNPSERRFVLDFQASSWSVFIASLAHAQ